MRRRVSADVWRVTRFKCGGARLGLRQEAKRHAAFARPMACSNSMATRPPESAVVAALCRRRPRGPSLANNSSLLNNPPVPKWIKFIIAVLLLPVCVAAGQTLWQVMRACGSADTTLVPIGGGAACWLAIYLLLPKPMWIYVFGHELTHVIWVWLFGGSVKKFKATSNGGHVIVDKTNFLIALSPYFFPLYAIIVVGVFVAGHWIWNWKDFFVWFHLLIGAAYAFHVTLNAHVLKTRQSDITSQGYLFSAVVIFLGNVLVLLVGLPLLTAKVDLRKMLHWWFDNTSALIHIITGWV
jgi:hypothetical protein